MAILTRKFSEFIVANLNATNKMVGLSAGANAIFDDPTTWTTATRPITPANGLLGFNTDLQQYEYYDITLFSWVQLEVGNLGNATFILQIPDPQFPAAQDLASLTTGILKSTTTTGVISISQPLTSIDTLATGPNRFLIASSSTTYMAFPALMDGQLIIGSTGLIPSAATLTQGSGVTITNGPGTITISATGGTVTSLSAGTGITLTPDPIVGVGSIALTVPVTAVLGGTGLTTYALGDTIYASAANTLSALTGNITTAKQYLSQTGTGAVSAAPIWSTIDGGDITGAALTKTDDTNVTLTLGGTPLTALLRSVSLALGWTGQLGLTRGGTGASLTASNGGIVYSTASVLAILSGTATAGQIVLSGSNAAPSWSAATYPSIAGTLGNVLTSDGTNWISSAPTAASPLTTKGDLYTFTTVNARLPVGSTNGQMLQVNSATASGLSWSTSSFPSTGGAAGNILISDGTNYIASTSLWPNTVGSVGKLLRSDGTTNTYTTSTYPDTNAINTLLYASSANVMAALATNNNSVLVTDSGGIPSLSTTLPSGLTIPGYAHSGANTDITSLTGLTGAIGAPTQIQSAAALKLMRFNYVASAVNFLDIYNNATGGAPAIVATGTDSSVNLFLQSKGGTIDLGDNATTNAATLRFFNAAATHFTALTVAAAQATNLSLRLPAADGTSGQALTTNGSGVLSFSSVGGGPWSTTGTNSGIGGGAGNTASGTNSLAYGVGNTNDGDNSIIVGNTNTLTASSSSMAMFGSNCNTSGSPAQFGLVAGNSSAVNGNYCFALGQSCTANGPFSFAGGTGSVSATRSFSFGVTCQSTARGCIVFGENATAANTGSFVFNDQSATGTNLTTSASNQWVTRCNGGYYLNLSATVVGLQINTSGSSLIATNTNDNAASGYVGEFISSVIASGSAVTATSNASSNITSISLTAGDWDVSGNANLVTGGTTPTIFGQWISTTSATIPDQSLYSAATSTATLSAGTGGATPYKRLSLATTTTVYLSCYLGNVSGNGTACGGIYARRAR